VTHEEYAERARELTATAATLMDAANEREMAGDKLLFATGSALVMAISGLTYAVLARGERGGTA
jgi:hypothetical protein